ncbi:MAG TPA: RidA family protein [Promineifilum sp.]|nr:RidA family protein [Promineifilum sp.]
MKTFRNPDSVHQPQGTYTHQVELQGPERLLVISGQVGARPDGSIPEDKYEQLDNVLDNIGNNLKAAGMDFGDVIKITYFLVGEWDLGPLREKMRARFAGQPPCSTMLFVAGLASPAYRVEIEAWASQTVE